MSRNNPLAWPAVVALVWFAPRLCADTVELLNGIRVQGTVRSETATLVVVEATMGGGTARMRFSKSKVHAITTGGRRRVINEKAGRKPPGTTRTKPPSRPTTTTGRVRRTRTQIEKLINEAGRTPPDWWDSVPLEYPKSLDLSWPDKPGGGWNANKNVGQYMFSIINENPGRWKSGTRFMHHMLTIHKDNPRVLNKVIGSLAHCYQDLLQDWPRAAFWRRKDIQRNKGRVRPMERLAECYWKLGSKSMATAQLARVRGYVSLGMIKLWSDMGELRKALSVAKIFSRAYPYLAYFGAGDAYRLHGRYDDAIRYYKKVLAVSATGKRKDHINKTHARARASIEAIKIYDTLDLKRIDEGTYRASSISYAGPLEVEVVVAGGRIESVKVTKYKDKQYFSALTETPKQIVKRQGVKGVDAVTGATITSEAIINATAKALAQGMK